MNLNQVTIPAVDMDESAGFYRRMGFTQIVDTPHYARFECPDGEATFSLSLVASAGAANFAIYFEHENLDELVQELAKAGFAFDQLPRDERYLWREARLQDPAGNRIILYRAGENRKNPPWRVEKSS
jgi:catechol 2,3-dioxygenase-like lactoylglutathione lyase family enzyme